MIGKSSLLVRHILSNAVRKSHSIGGVPGEVNFRVLHNMYRLFLGPMFSCLNSIVCYFQIHDNKNLIFCHLLLFFSTKLAKLLINILFLQNLPFSINNRFKLTAYFVLFFGSGLGAPFLIVRHQLLKK